MSESKVDLKNPVVAAVLGFLIPGAGHLYQGRVFKSVLYSICILGLFFSGSHLGDWKLVYFKWEPAHRTIGYFSQVLVGLPALPAFVQHARFRRVPARDNGFRFQQPPHGEGPLRTTFIGFLHDDDGTTRKLAGELELKVVQGNFGEELGGRLTGEIEGQGAMEFTLGRIEIGPRICASEEIPLSALNGAEGTRTTFSATRRHLKGEFTAQASSGDIEGTIPRGFWDWYQVPLENRALEGVEGRLGKYAELARVFTWIAGLLNLLAIWDALEGPAYGYGNETELSESEESTQRDRHDKPSIAMASHPSGAEICAPTEKTSAAAGSS